LARSYIIASVLGTFLYNNTRPGDVPIL